MAMHNDPLSVAYPNIKCSTSMEMYTYNDTVINSKLQFDNAISRILAIPVKYKNPYYQQKYIYWYQ